MPAQTPARGPRGTRGSTAPDHAVSLARQLHRSARDAATADRHPAAIRQMRRGLALLDTPGIDPQERLEVRTRLRNTLAFCLAETGKVDDGLTQLAGVGQELAQLRDEALRAHLSTLVNLNRAALLCRVGRMDEGIAQLDREIELSERRLVALGDPVTGGPAANGSGAGADREALDLLALALSNRGNAHGEVHRHDKAVRDLHRAVELADAHDLPLRAAIAKHALGNAVQRA
ncbi:MAG: hypothetical protein HOV68_13910, partial [Streptomycetaceae bacterium]|nr:hypothetical protein [Streptomycetaceae bacterium]